MRTSDAHDQSTRRVRDWIVLLTGVKVTGRYGPEFMKFQKPRLAVSCLAETSS